MIKSALLALAVLFITGCSTMEVTPDSVAVETAEHGQCLSTGKGSTLSFKKKRVSFICPDGYVLLGMPYEKSDRTVMDAGRLRRSEGRFILQPIPAVEIRRGLRSRCQLVPDPGPCEEPVKKYYFDTKTKSCRPFLWGGCGGIVPFESMDECEQECIR
jgi:hypothetical protein